MFTEHPPVDSSDNSSFHSASSQPRQDTQPDESPSLLFHTPSTTPPPLSHPRRPSQEAQNHSTESLPLDPPPYTPHNVGTGIPSSPTHRPLSPPYRGLNLLFQPSAQPGPSFAPILSNPFDSFPSPSNTEFRPPSPGAPPLAIPATAPNPQSTSAQDIVIQCDTIRPSILPSFQELPPPPLLPVAPDLTSPSNFSTPLSSPRPISSTPPSLLLSIPPTSPVTALANRSPPLIPPSYRPSSPHDIVNTLVPSSLSSKIDLAQELSFSPPSVYRSPQATYINIPYSPTLNPSNAQSSPNGASPDMSSQIELPELDSGDVTTLEKVFLFSQSPMTFHRIFIVRSLARYLKHGMRRHLKGSSDVAGEVKSMIEEGSGIVGEGEENVFVDDRIQPSEAVKYVLPLLPILATDQDEMVKEALASELVSIIWWFLTHCRVVEDSACPLQSEDLVLPEDAASADHLSNDGIEDMHLDRYYVSRGPRDPTHNDDLEATLPQGSPVGLLGLTIHEATSSESAGSTSPSTEHSPDEFTSNSEQYTPETRSSFPFDFPSCPSPLVPAVPSGVPLVSQIPSGEEDLTISDGPVPGPTLISVQSFSDILASLLLSPNVNIGGPARLAVVELLKRIRKADESERISAASEVRTRGPIGSPISPRGWVGVDNGEGGRDEDDDEGTLCSVGLFGIEERRLFEREIVQQVVIGIGRLGIPDESTESESGGASTNDDDESEQTSTEFFDLPTPLARPPYPSSEDVTPGVTETFTDSYFPPVPFPVSEEHMNTTENLAPLSQLPSAPRSSSPELLSSSAQPWSGSAVMDPLSPTTFSPSHSPSPSSLSPPSPAPSTASLSAPSTPSLVSSSSSSAISPASGKDISPPVADGIPSTLVSTPFSAQLRDLQLPTSSEGWVQPRSVDGQGSTTENAWGISHPTFDLHEPTSSSSFGGSDDAVASNLPPWPQHSEWDESEEEEEFQDDDEAAARSEEAAVGRLSSMSLMAAVTASGSLTEENEAAFVVELERVGRDSVYWVRREASFALGALAKVVPVEVVTSSLLPLFHSLCRDPTEHVRQSSLYALPAIISRLSSSERRRIALDVILPLSMDDSPRVRAGVLEALAEVMYAFRDDDGGPPDELLKLFLGIREGEETRRPVAVNSSYRITWDDLINYTKTHSVDISEGDNDIYEDPTRPLVCAFNYPAVALTLGRARWSELRELYGELAENEGLQVRKTLAASLGELAKIVGPENAKADLMGVWQLSVGSEHGDVRLKAVECLEVFLRALGESERAEVMKEIVGDVWDNRLRGWREREGVVKVLGAIVQMDGIENDLLRELVVKGLEDPVAAVREAAVAVIPPFLNTWSTHPESLKLLMQNIEALGTSTSYRKRMTYLACQQGIIESGQIESVIGSNTFWQTLKTLVEDPIVGVRIRTARLLTILSEQLSISSGPSQSLILELGQRLAEDPSHEVAAFARHIVSGSPGTVTTEHIPPGVLRSTSNFSRPPPATPG